MVNLQQIFGQLTGVLQNPAQFLASRGMPNAMQNPQQMVQDLLNSGRMSQEQFNQLKQTAEQIQQMPQFKQYFK